MNFQQLRIIREAVRRDFNLTEVANALYTSQSGVSKHIKDLEDELGIELFIRRGKRLTEFFPGSPRNSRGSFVRHSLFCRFVLSDSRTVHGEN